MVAVSVAVTELTPHWDAALIAVEVITMCGRYSSYTHERLRPIEDALQQKLIIIDELPVRYNIAPSQQVIVVRPAVEQGYEVANVKWGLIPHWANEPRVPYSTINARSENVAKSPAFRNAFRHRRCLIPADGFYEWKRLTGSKTKQPYYIHRADGSPFAFAGLWERWEQDGEALESCTIMTTDANELMAEIHNRMPVILDPQDYAAWISKENAHPGELLKPFPSEGLQAYAISTRVNSPKNDDPQCIESLKG